MVAMGLHAEYLTLFIIVATICINILLAFYRFFTFIDGSSKVVTLEHKANIAPAAEHSSMNLSDPSCVRNASPPPAASFSMNSSSSSSAKGNSSFSQRIPLPNERISHRQIDSDTSITVKSSPHEGNSLLLQRIHNGACESMRASSRQSLLSSADSSVDSTIRGLILDLAATISPMWRITSAAITDSRRNYNVPFYTTLAMGCVLSHSQTSPDPLRTLSTPYANGISNLDLSTEATAEKIGVVNAIEQTESCRHGTNAHRPFKRQRYRHYGQKHEKSSPVIVSALFDIGRGNWVKYTRTYNQYLRHLWKLLQLKNRLVIYTDIVGAAYVREWWNEANTEVIETSVESLPFYRFHEDIQAIIKDEQENWRFDPRIKDRPEANSTLYNILVNSKPYFLYNATLSSRFRENAEYFTWIDAGYGQGGSDVIPVGCNWTPILSSERITIIKITPEHDKLSRYSIDDLYRTEWVVVSGGFIGGTYRTINKFYRFYYKVFLDLLNSSKMDDDQTVLTMVVKNYENIFDVKHSGGAWFDLFKLFPCEQQKSE